MIVHPPIYMYELDAKDELPFPLSPLPLPPLPLPSPECGGDVPFPPPFPFPEDESVVPLPAPLPFPGEGDLVGVVLLPFPPFPLPMGEAVGGELEGCKTLGA